MFKVSVKLYTNNRGFCHSCQLGGVIAFFLVIWVWHPISNDDGSVIALRSHDEAFEWYQNTTSPPPVQLILLSIPSIHDEVLLIRRLSLSRPWGLFGFAPPLSDPPRCFSAWGPNQQGLLFSSGAFKSTHIECGGINFQILFHVWFGSHEYLIPFCERWFQPLQTGIFCI